MKIGLKMNLLKIDLYLVGMEFGVILPRFFRRYNDKQTNTRSLSSRNGQPLWREQAN